MNIQEQVADIQARMDAAQRERLRAEGSRDAAKAAAEKAAADLDRDFGITTAEQAQAMLDTLRAELMEIVEQLRQALDEAGA